MSCKKCLKVWAHIFKRKRLNLKMGGLPLWMNQRTVHCTKQKFHWHVCACVYWSRVYECMCKCVPVKAWRTIWHTCEGCVFEGNHSYRLSFTQLRVGKSRLLKCLFRKSSSTWVVHCALKKLFWKTYLS